ncbi:hypothetical protein OS493_030162 [Desmophyllum pertusum]|uniref:Uncharacterized protein n=1 Tax=Desmophyllum pertusum TaxID=174260 RepID=A0A9W9YWF7_9CNID|nr:hypothetical protein OS493_030162 [Desmophyllum pertusum]
MTTNSAVLAGVDILMTDLLSDVQYFNQAGPKSYAFLVHSKTGHTMSHPKLPTPESITEDPNSVNILELEQGEEFKQLFEDVQKTGKFREKTFKTRTSSISRGAVQGDGVQTEEVDYKYSCMPVDVREKDYIVCVALEKGDTGATYKSLFIDRSVIKFSAKAFVDSSGYLEADDSKKAIQGYVDQMKGIVYRYQQSDVFTKDTVITAMLTSMADDTWFSTVNQKKYLRKFCASLHRNLQWCLARVSRSTSTNEFDHISRPWFIRAVANEDLVSLTAPYLDPLGAGFIVSISETLKTEHGKKKPIWCYWR